MPEVVGQGQIVHSCGPIFLSDAATTIEFNQLNYVNKEIYNETVLLELTYSSKPSSIVKAAQRYQVAPQSFASFDPCRRQSCLGCLKSRSWERSSTFASCEIRQEHLGIWTSCVARTQDSAPDACHRSGSCPGHTIPTKVSSTGDLSSLSFSVAEVN